MRLEVPFWDALEEILEKESLTMSELVTRIDKKITGFGNLSSAVRVFVYSYFYTLAKRKGPNLPPDLGWKSEVLWGRTSRTRSR
ncbi:ribbon-helix-helix domain-containing protein [Inquilinus sp. OTU3971]|uniref:ribbon-helix-helix domain-containing protein n=1 Tax=Inquilinus sp. OTU3971 TaxID=3043855 RepID=UPI00313E216C